MNENLHPHQYCQSVLRFLYVNRLDTQNNSKWVMTRLKLQFPDIGEYIFEDVIAVLFNDGFLETDRGVLPKLHPFYMIYFTISDKGIAFYFTDTYENRRKREQLQLDLLESQIEVHKSTLITNANIISTNKNTEITNGILKSIFRWTAIIAAIGVAVGGLNIYLEFHKDSLKQQIQTKDSLLQVKESEILRFENMR